MNARDRAVQSLQEAQAELAGQRPTIDQRHMMMAIMHHLHAIDEDIQKLRKELRVRNGGSDVE
jgi:hypothetical protein